jgi:tetratricopeptide (TPR) repeat protein
VSQRKKWIAAGLAVGGLGLGGLFLIPSPKPPGPLDCPGPPLEYTEQAEHLREAKILMREGKWVEAREVLMKVQQQDPDQHELPDYLFRVEQEIRHQNHLVAAQAALSVGQLTQAKTELDAVTPDTMQYEQLGKLQRELKDAANQRVREAQALRDQGQLEQAQTMALAVLALFPEHAEASALVTVEPLELTPLTAPAPKQPIDHFMDGDLPAAVKLAQACASSSPECKAELEALKEFSILYRKGERMGTQRLVRLVALDRELAGTASPSRLTHELITQLRQKAKELYLLCYALKDTDPGQARTKFHKVMALTLPEDEIHQKAKSWLEKLQR